MEFGVPSIEREAPNPMPPPPPPPCSMCAAVKRLKTSSVGGGGDSKWMPQKCNCAAAASSAVTAQLMEQPSGMSVPLTNAIDTLRPRRLFEGLGCEDDGEVVLPSEMAAAAATSEEQAAAAAGDPSSATVDAGSSSGAQQQPVAAHSHEQESVVPSVFDLLDDDEEGEEDAEPDAECFSIFRPPDVDVSGAEVGLSGGYISGEGGGFCASGGGLGSLGPNGLGGMAFLQHGRSRSFSPSPLLHRPCTPLSPFGGDGAPRWERGPSPPPPPQLPPSSVEAARDAFRGLHNQSPGLMLASARFDMGLRSSHGGGSSHGASSCATPSRAPLPLRPPTPGAPGSNMRRTTSFMEGFDASPGVTPERSGVVPMSLTDTALMQLTQSLTSISIGPIGQKRSIQDRDA